MKEHTIEEKAKAYDKALSVAQETYTTQPTYRDWLEKMFPELKESEDEKIRKALIKFHKSTIDVDGIKGEDVLAWLEKQGDNPTPINIDKMVMEYSQTKDSDFGMPVNCMIRAYRQGIIDVLNLSSGIEKQGEQKITDKYNIRGIKSKHAKGKLGEMIKEMKSADKTESIVHNYITPNPQFFQWIYNRLIHIHNENPSMDYMLSLKERVEDMQKSAWSVEDEDMLDNIIDDYDDADEHNLVDDIGKVMWLKSLKQRMEG